MSRRECRGGSVEEGVSRSECVEARVCRGASVSRSECVEERVCRGASVSRSEYETGVDLRCVHITRSVLAAEGGKERPTTHYSAERRLHLQ